MRIAHRTKLVQSYEKGWHIYDNTELWYNPFWSEIEYMGTYPPPYQEPTFEPTAEQLARDRILRRRTWLYIYLPLGLVTLVAIILLVLILIAIFAPGTDGTLIFLSAVADIIVILWIIPAMLMVAILPVAYGAYRLNRRQKRKLDPQAGPLANRSRLQILAWRLQQFMDQVEGKSGELAPRVAKPVTDANAFFAYVGAWFTILKRPFTGRDNHERDRHRDGSGA